MVDGDPEVDVAVHDELAVADARIEVRELGQRVDHRPADERQVGEREALGRPPVVLDRPARGVDVRIVHLDDAERVR